MSEDEIRGACDLIRSIAGGDHPVACPVMATTRPDARHRLDQELPVWGKAAGSSVGIAGDAAQFAASIRRLAGFGVTSVAIQPCAGEPDLSGLVRFLGAEVRPLLDQN